MTEQEKSWFREIAENREAAWNVVLSKRAFRNIMRGVVEKYAGLGHFVYELLQNADDVGATDGEFELKSDKLIFRHNGEIKFTVTSLESEEDENTVSGHLNAITSVGASTKVLENRIGNAIGKFGVGFKAVFKYTNRPEIYDDNMAFALEHYIIPRQIETDYEGRKPGETIFVFPFDENINPRAYEEISKALQSLLFPTLFLNNLKRVKYSLEDKCGEYRVDNLYQSNVVAQDEMTVQKLSVVAKAYNEETATKMWLFTKNRNGNRCSVGYIVNEEGELVPAEYFAFCFFPTRHQTKLNFIVHAPFLLTDSREGILSGSEHNERMINELASIAVDGIKYLCSRYETYGERKRIVTENVVNIIPIKEENYGDGISFDAFRREFEKLFKSERVIPTSDGYVDKKHAYWPSSYQLPKLFDDEKLQKLYNEDGIKWVFPSIPDEKKSGNIGDEIFHFIRTCVKNSASVTDASILQNISSDFIRDQDSVWLGRLYDWIYVNEERVKMARYVPIFLNQNSEPCAIRCRENKELNNLYIPLPGADGSKYNMVREDLWNNESARKLLTDKYEIKEPQKGDWIRGIVSDKLYDAPLEQKNDWIKHVLEYYVSECGGEEKVSIVEGLQKVTCWRAKGDNAKVYCSRDLYFDNEELGFYFNNHPQVKYIDLELYYAMVADRYKSDIKNLFEQLGVNKFPRIINIIMKGQERDYLIRTRADFPREVKNHLEGMEEPRIEGLKLILERIAAADSPERKKEISLRFWNLLGEMAVVKSRNVHKDGREWFVDSMSGSCSYRYHGLKSYSFKSSHYERLCTSKWLVSSNNQMVSPRDASQEMIFEHYGQSQVFGLMCSMLEIPKNTERIDEDARKNLSNNDRVLLALGERLKEKGIFDITEDEIQELLRVRNEKSKQSIVSMENPAPHVVPIEVAEENVMGEFEKITQKVRKTILKKKESKNNTDSQVVKPGQRLLPAFDSDLMQPRIVPFEIRASELQSKLNAEMDQLKVESGLYQKAMEAEEYSYAWLKARLELEMRASGADSEESSKEASVSFAKMEREEGTGNMFILSATADVIPQWFEEEVNQRLTIRILGRQDIETVIESMSVLQFRLRAKVRILPGMENIDYSKVVEARTVATKPMFLLKALSDGYDSLKLADDYNLKTNLPPRENMRFVFGPPGTGKTTYLAREIIIPLAIKAKSQHVLVLAPTNKAADVLTNRIIKECGEDTSYTTWLTRFGITTDPYLQESEVARGKDVVIKDEDSAIVVTTIDRFSYDNFMSAQMDYQKLADFNWDYIIIDEASMIPLMKILYPLYKAKNARFVIAGDPMQIAPVVLSDMSTGQNIYTMVGLNDFANPTTEPNEYEVVCLKKQFRSLPAVGQIFSEFAYSGLLEHYRSSDESANLELDIHGMPVIKPLTLLRYPVSRFESIFKIKLLGMSSYHIYSALFVFEYICKIAEGLRKDCQKERFRIGVISPYRAQADIVNRLVEKINKSEFGGVEVNVGTVHSFQGDECEMIIALLNPPQGMGRREGSFINDKKVLNVAISRARDFLVVAIPNDNTPNLQYLQGPLEIARLMRERGEIEFAEIKTTDLELNVWGNEDYIETNTFSTGHQDVNVYETPEKRFEVRTEKTALDIHFRADKKLISPKETMVKSDREKIEEEHKADDCARKKFKIPEGFHKPEECELPVWQKRYYIIGNDSPLICENEFDDIDQSKILAIED